MLKRSFITQNLTIECILLNKSNLNLNLILICDVFVTPSQILWWGIVITFVCLSVCLSVRHFVRKHDWRRTKHPILMKFGQIVYNHNRKVKFEDGLCPLIFKATAVKKPLEMMKISHYKSDFQHIDVKFAQ